MTEKKQINQSAEATEAQYVAPQIEVIEVETSQNILGGSLDPIDEGGFV